METIESYFMNALKINRLFIISAVCIESVEGRGFQAKVFACKNLNIENEGGIEPL